MLQTALQKDLAQWASKWQMCFNIGKCTVMRCTRPLHPIVASYSLYGSNLVVSDQHMYLGVMLDKSLSWSSHITHIANKATRMLNFLKRHLSKCSTKIKASSYLPGADPGFSERGSEHRSVSLMQGVWGGCAPQKL